VVSLLDDLVWLNAANVSLFKDQSVVDYPFGCFGRIEQDPKGRGSAKQFVPTLKSCNVVDIEALGCEVVLFHDFLDVLCLVLRQRDVFSWGAVNHNPEPWFD